MKADSFGLDLEHLHNFNDEVTKDFNAQFQGAVADCRKRPACNKSRSVTLKLELRPNQIDSADVDVGMVVSSKIPAANHVIRRGRATSRNQLLLDFDQGNDFGAEGEESNQ